METANILFLLAVEISIMHLISKTLTSPHFLYRTFSRQWRGNPFSVDVSVVCIFIYLSSNNLLALFAFDQRRTGNIRTPRLDPHEE